jgi:hypothetical protein
MRYAKVTTPLQNCVLLPTSTSYLRANVSLPSLPMRKTVSPALSVLMVPLSRTGSGCMLAATIMRALGSIAKVRSWMPCPSMFWISIGSPVFWLIENTAMLFSPPANTFSPSKSTVDDARLA